MLGLERTSSELLDIEVSIINSDTFFNKISKDKDFFSSKEILEEIKQSNNLGAERFFIRDNMEYIGILEYLLKNPSDGCAWLGLLLIDKKYQSKGYGNKVLNLFYGIMKEKGVDRFRIGVIAENGPAHKFWKKNGFEYVKSTINQDKKEIVVYEKAII
ncbi:MAG: GNAT family N-acetyltransferase [Bacillota bacterium]